MEQGLGVERFAHIHTLPSVAADVVCVNSVTKYVFARNLSLIRRDVVYTLRVVMWRDH